MQAMMEDGPASNHRAFSGSEKDAKINALDAKNNALDAKNNALASAGSEKDAKIDTLAGGLAKTVLVHDDPPTETEELKREKKFLGENDMNEPPDSEMLLADSTEQYKALVASLKTLLTTPTMQTVLKNNAELLPSNSSCGSYAPFQSATPSDQQSNIPTNTAASSPPAENQDPGADQPIACGPTDLGWAPHDDDGNILPWEKNGWSTCRPVGFAGVANSQERYQVSALGCHTERCGAPETLYHHTSDQTLPRCV